MCDDRYKYLVNLQQLIKSFYREFIHLNDDDIIMNDNLNNLK